MHEHVPKLAGRAVPDLVVVGPARLLGTHWSSFHHQRGGGLQAIDEWEPLTRGAVVVVQSACLDHVSFTFAFAMLARKVVASIGVLLLLSIAERGKRELHDVTNRTQSCGHLRGDVAFTSGSQSFAVKVHGNLVGGQARHDDRGQGKGK